MKKGFLGGGAPAKSSECAKDTSTAQATPSFNPSTSDQPNTNKPLFEQLNETQVNVGLEQCIELLQSQSDEKKLVGLLLAAKILPSGGDQVVK